VRPVRRTFPEVPRPSSDALRADLQSEGLPSVKAFEIPSSVSLFERNAFEYWWRANGTAAEEHRTADGMPTSLTPFQARTNVVGRRPTRRVGTIEVSTALHGHPLASLVVPAPDAVATAQQQFRRLRTTLPRWILGLKNLFDARARMQI
jgi:hypothetical protein